MCGALSAEENAKGKGLLDRIVAMLTRLGRRGCTVREEPAEYAAVGVDPDADTDSDPERERPNNSMQWTALRATRRPRAALPPPAPEVALTVPRPLSACVLAPLRLCVERTLGTLRRTSRRLGLLARRVRFCLSSGSISISGAPASSGLRRPCGRAGRLRRMMPRIFASHH